jgi:hypothetical protein
MEGESVGTLRHTKFLLVVCASLVCLLAAGLADAASSAPAPSGPTALTSTVASSLRSVKLQWRTGSETRDTLQRSTQPDTGFTAVGAAKRVSRPNVKFSRTDGTVTAGKTYYYRVAGDTPSGIVYSDTITVPVGVVPTTPPTTTTTTTPTGDGGGEARWWQGYGDINNGRDLGKKIVTDDTGDLTFSTLISADTRFGSITAKTAAPAAAIVRENDGGTVRWVRTIKANVNGLASDPRNDDVIVAGTFVGDVDFGNGVVHSHISDMPDLFVARYTKDNALAWVRNYGPQDAHAWATPNAVAVGPAGEAVVTGYFDGTFDFGKGWITNDHAANVTGQRGTFLASYSAAGVPSWTRGFSLRPDPGMLADSGGLAVAVDGQGNVGLTGLFTGMLNLGGSDLKSTNASSSKDSADIFIAEFTSAGTHSWSKRFGDAYEDRGTAVAFEPNGALVAAGYYAGTINFGGGALTNPSPTLPGFGTFPEQDLFLVQFSGAGAHQWSQHFVPANPDGFHGGQAQSLAIGGNGDIVMGGTIVNDVDFGGGPLPKDANDLDAYVAKFASSGAHKWSHRYRATWDDVTEGVATNGAGEVFATGYYEKQIGTLPAHPDSAIMPDVFVVKLAS